MAGLARDRFRSSPDGYRYTEFCELYRRWLKRRELSEASSYRLAREIAHPDQVVHGQQKGNHPAHPRHPARGVLAQQATLFEPAEELFAALTLPLAHQVAAVPRGAAIDRTRTLRGVLGHMRGYREAPEA